MIRRGAAALILTILVLGFMMAISSSYVTMVQTETRTQSVLDKGTRAKDAAFAGINYVIARLLATSSTFLVTSSQTDLKQKRLYFACDATAASKNNRFSGLTPTVFSNVASSQWLFPTTDGLLMEDEIASAVAFRVTSYPATDTANLVVPDIYYVKSQGIFRDIENGRDVLATYSAQYVARLLIATPAFSVRLERYQVMETEPTVSTGTFFTQRAVIRP